MLKPVPKIRKSLIARSSATGSLFVPRPGVPIEDALEHASCLINAAMELARDLAMVDGGHASWPVVYMLENAQALVDSSAISVAGVQQ